MNFTIDSQYLTSVTVRQEWSIYADREDLTPEELIKMLKGEGRCSSVSSIDHPEFTRLRDQLESDGYIKTQRNCWNGDTVLQSFTLNGYIFRSGDRFPCADALRLDFQFR